MTSEDIDNRLSSLEQAVAQLRIQQVAIASEAAAARILAAGADHDVSQVRAAYLAQTRLLEALRQTQVEHGQRLDSIDGRLDRVDGRLDRVDGRLDGIDGRLDRVDGRLDSIDGRLDGLQTGMAEILRLLIERDN